MWLIAALSLSSIWSDNVCMGDVGADKKHRVDEKKSNLFNDILAFDVKESAKESGGGGHSGYTRPHGGKVFHSRYQRPKTFVEEKPDLEKSDFEKYIDGLKKGIKNFRCARGCSEFDSDFDTETKFLASKLVNLPPVEGISIENTFKTMASVMMNLRSEVDKPFYQKSLIMAIMERNDTKDVKIINAVFLEPENIIPRKGRDYAGTFESLADDFELNSPLIGLSEAKIDYFREVWALHDFHKTWHSRSYSSLPRQRHYERFEYMHRQFLFRYIVERLNLGLQVIQPLDLDALGKTFTSLYPNENFDFYSGNKMSCNLEQGDIDSLKRLWEYSRRFFLRGSMEQFFEDIDNNIHGTGHILIGQRCRTDSRKEGFMFRPEVSARDPLFYRWHLFIEKVLHEYKENHPYTQRDLSPAAGISVDNVTLKSRCSKENLVENYYKVSNVVSGNSNPIAGKTLISEPFEISISITNEGARKRSVIVRVFLIAEKHKDTGEYAIEMDRFVEDLPADEKVVIKRKSENNALTYQEHSLSCAWPIYLYLPKGGEETPNKFRLVVFIHDPTNDRVNEGKLDYGPFMFCGADNTRHDVRFDERNFGFPMDKEWSGMDRRDVLSGSNRLFGNISTPLDIVFTREKKPECESNSGVVPSNKEKDWMTLNTEKPRQIADPNVYPSGGNNNRNNGNKHNWNRWRTSSGSNGWDYSQRDQKTGNPNTSTSKFYLIETAD